MKNMPQNSQPDKATSQVTKVGNSTTGHYYWVGHCHNGVHYYAGQTFKASRRGILRNIGIFPEMIVGETDAALEVYEFDEKNRAFAEKKAEKRLVLNKSMEQKWIKFPLDLQLENNRKYVFKISCNHGGMMAIAECSWRELNPYPDGEQWLGSSENPAGSFHPNFDIAFIAEIENY
jgi:hypothetical protein